MTITELIQQLSEFDDRNEVIIYDDGWQRSYEIDCVCPSYDHDGMDKILIMLKEE